MEGRVSRGDLAPLTSGTDRERLGPIWTAVRRSVGEENDGMDVELTPHPQAARPPMLRSTGHMLSHRRSSWLLMDMPWGR